MALFSVFAILFALAAVNNAQSGPDSISFDQLFKMPYGSLPSGTNGGASGGLPSVPIGGYPGGSIGGNPGGSIGGNPGGDQAQEVRKIMAEGCEGMSHIVLGTQMRQSCSTYCGSSFMIGTCYNRVCYCSPR